VWDVSAILSTGRNTNIWAVPGGTAQTPDVIHPSQGAITVATSLQVSAGPTLQTPILLPSPRRDGRRYPAGRHGPHPPTIRGPRHRAAETAIRRPDRRPGAGDARLQRA